MNPILGWSLALLALGAGWWRYGWPGLALAATAIVFWLLLQFSRALRVMKSAGRSPVGHVPSAAMLNTKLKPGMLMLDVVAIACSLGQRMSEDPDTYLWTDDAGLELVVSFEQGRCRSWQLHHSARADAGPTG
jgi:hypothetical protein